VGLTVTGASALVAAIIGIVVERRAAYDRVLNLIDYISSAEVASARDELGRIVAHPDRDSMLSAQDADYVDERIRDLFVVLWAFQRIDATRKSLWRNWPLNGPHKLLQGCTEDWVKYWSGRNVEIVRSGLEAGKRNQLPGHPDSYKLDIAGSNSGLKRLSSDWLS
jgi:hypothetical protein